MRHTRNGAIAPGSITLSLWCVPLSNFCENLLKIGLKKYDGRLGM